MTGKRRLRPAIALAAMTLLAVGGSLIAADLPEYPLAEAARLWVEPVSDDPSN